MTASMLTACLPYMLREHVAVGTTERSRCGLGPYSFSELAGKTKVHVSLLEDKNGQFGLSATIDGRNGALMQIPTTLVVVTFADGEVRQITPSYLVSEIGKTDQGIKRTLILPGQTMKFVSIENPSKKEADDHFQKLVYLQIQVSFDEKKTDFEVQFHDLNIDGQRVLEKPLRYEHRLRWGLMPLNGC